jgi:hypothetical protein
LDTDVILSKIVIGVRTIANIMMISLIFFTTKKLNYKRIMIIRGLVSLAINLFLIFGDGFHDLIDKNSIFWGPFILYEIVLQFVIEITIIIVVILFPMRLKRWN